MLLNNFRSKVMLSFKKVKKDMSVISKKNNEFFRNLNRLNNRCSKIESQIQNFDKKLKEIKNKHFSSKNFISNENISKLIQRIDFIEKNGFSSVKPKINNISSKLDNIKSDLSSEIDGIKFELSKSSENSYQAYSDVILLQRELSNLKKENEVLRDDLRLFVRGEIDSKVNILSDDIKLVKSQVYNISSNTNCVPLDGILSVAGNKSQKKISSFIGLKPISKIFSKKKKKEKISLDVKNNNYEKSKDGSSATLNYNPGGWVKISGYKKVERKGKQSGYLW